MHRFTTRPEISGTFGVVASTHWIASSVGMAMLERGGNAFDAAVAAGFALQIVEPHLNGPGGDLPGVFFSARTGRVEVLGAQGPAPAGASIAHYRAEGLKTIPGDGLLATVIPGAFDGWMLMLRDHGRLSLQEVLEPAIFYAQTGHPLLPAAATAIAGRADFFRAHWPTSAETWLPGGNVPAAQSRFKNPVLAQTYRRIVAEGMAQTGRDAQIEAARDAFYRGFVAEAVDGFVRTAELMDSSGSSHKGVLTAADMAGWQARYEAPATYDYHGWTLAKTGPWGQGPVLLQSLALLAQTDVAAMDPLGADFVHTVAEALKLSLADREAYYGDPDFVAVPLDHLLSDDYNRARAGLIGERAAHDLRPGIVPGYQDQVTRGLANLERNSPLTGAVYEPTMAHLAQLRGDTVHIDAVDAEGNFVSVTPSGGWLQSSPIIPELGFCLNSRAQMFWLDETLPNALAPGKRPRTTLTPTLALKDGRPTLAFGTPGGDQQDQWQLVFFLRHIHHGYNLQEALDLPLFHTNHAPASFAPRARRPGDLSLEASFGDAVIAELGGRGHALSVVPPWSVGRLTAARRDADGLLRAAATPRLMQAYAVGR